MVEHLPGPQAPHLHFADQPVKVVQAQDFRDFSHNREPHGVFVQYSKINLRFMGLFDDFEVFSDRWFRPGSLREKVAPCGFSAFFMSGLDLFLVFEVLVAELGDKTDLGLNERSAKALFRTLHRLLSLTLHIQDIK